MKHKTHTKCSGATWPSVACHYARLQWVEGILKDANLDCFADEVSLAMALLRYVADGPGSSDERRIMCFRALLVLEKHDWSE